ncbi:MAG TPA: hypothetical protein VFR58_02740 [Flavisolibacter sp.]|nr:hypothetical protein [Flavisolibacter sp.]
MQTQAVPAGFAHPENDYKPDPGALYPAHPYENEPAQAIERPSEEELAALFSAAERFGINFL